MSKNIVILFVMSFLFFVFACSTVEEVRDVGSSDIHIKDAHSSGDSLYDISDISDDSLSDISDTGCMSGSKRCDFQKVQNCMNGVWVDGEDCSQTGKVCVNGSCVYNTKCKSDSCSGHGICSDSSGKVVCTCDTGYTGTYCESCASGYHRENTLCVKDNPCNGVTCSNHGVCKLDSLGNPKCECDSGYHSDGLNCISDNNPCDGVGCSAHGKCVVQRDGAVCICDEGYSPGDASGLTCVPTSQVCVGGAIDYDVDNDGSNDSWFEPNERECLMYELVNRTRASHNDEGTPECHKPLLWSVEWSAHGRNHSYKMRDRGGLFHEDYPWGQNCAYGCEPACEMDMYMNGANEGHCEMLSHHCNIMRCGFSHIGIGYVDTWNTQNFY